MAIHRVNTLPEARPLVNGDEYIVKNTDGTASSYKVGKDGEPVFLRGLSDDDSEKIKNSYSKNQVDEKIDLAVTQIQGETIPITGTVLPQGLEIPSWVTTTGKAQLLGGRLGKTYTQTGGSPIAVTANYMRYAYYNKTTNIWTQGEEAELPKGADGKTIADWVAQPYVIGSQVFSDNILYENTAATTLLEVPGTSPKWVKKITGINQSVIDNLSYEIDNVKVTAIIQSQDDDIHHFTDQDGALLAKIDKFGTLHALPSPDFKENVNYLVRMDIPSYLFAVLSSTNQVLFGVKDDGTLVPNSSDSVSVDGYYNAAPYEQSKGELAIKTLIDIKEFINLPSVAFGRQSAEGAGDEPKIPLTTTGYTHPSVLHVPSGWNGYTYWLAITPTFGIIAQQPDSAAFENPHIFCSNDGINWQEPAGISNPIDTPPAINSGYWSDTHLMLMPDGYLYCVYRGNSVPNYKIGVAENPNFVKTGRVDVYKKSKDGVHWENVVVVQDTQNVGINGNSGIMSPAFFYDNGQINCYDVVWGNSVSPAFVGEGQINRIVMRRTAKDLGDFKNVAYRQNNVVNFKNAPWGEGKDVWHLDACKWGNTYFLLVNVSPTDLDTGTELYLAYSGDGWNFKVIDTAISLTSTYRSCMVPVKSNATEIKFWIYHNLKSDGSTHVRELTLNYK